MQIILNNLNISKKENLYKNIFYTININFLQFTLLIIPLTNMSYKNI